MENMTKWFMNYDGKNVTSIIPAYKNLFHVGWYFWTKTLAQNTIKNAFKFSETTDYKENKKKVQNIFLLNKISQIMIKIQNINIQI